MVKYIKFILFLFFSVALYSMVNDVSAAKVEEDLHVVQVVGGAEKSMVTSSQMPYSPDAELVGGYSLTHQITMSRVQRTHMTEYSLSLKAVLQSLAHREAALSQHKGRIFDTTTSYYCHPSSQYYVFALRRILI